VEVVDLFVAGLGVAVHVATPLLLAVSAAGLVVAVFQAMTQIQEQTLQFIAKLLVCAVVLFAIGRWGGLEVMKLAINAFDFARVAGR